MEYPKFSLDLEEACLRNEGFFKNKSLNEIRQYIDEYKKFWHIINKYQENAFSPTLEIDSVWHLHMLHPQNYYNDCFEYFGVILPHNAGFGKKAEEVEQLNLIFDTGNDLWEKEYGYRLKEKKSTQK